MHNKHIPTCLGTAILVVIAITAGVFVWTYEKGRDPIAVQIPQQPTPKTSKPPVTQESQPTITDATIIKGWKKYTAADNSFSIEYPSEWRLEGRSVFYDSSNKKIAELPGIIAISENEQCFDKIQKDIDANQNRIKLVSKKDTLINGSSWTRGTLDVMADFGIHWFPNMFCIKNGNDSFTMTFYEHEVSSPSKNLELYKKILSTLEAKQDTSSGSENIHTGWETYTDTTSGYTVRYPQGYTIEKFLPPCRSKRNDTSGQNVVIWRNETETSDVATDSTKGEVQDFDIFIDDPEDKCIQGFSSIGGPKTQTPVLISSENVTVNGYLVLKRTYNLNPEGETALHSTWRFNKNGEYYTLMFNNGSRLTNPEHQNAVFEKFLESFKLK